MNSYSNSVVEWASERNRIYAEIRNRIVSGQLAPGEVITLRGLASQFGTSAMPVREAMTRLVSEGAIELRSNRTFQVVKLSSERFLEIKQIRMSLEGWAAELAATRISADEIAYLRHLIERMEDDENAKGGKYLEYNRQLHFTIYRASRMPELVTIIENLWAKYGPVLTYFSEAAGARHEGNLVHRSLVASISRRDGVGARSAVQEDISSAAERIYPQLLKEEESLGTSAAE